MKLLIRFFLFVCLVLVNGLGYAHAPKQQDDVYISTINIIEWHKQVTVETLPASKVVAVRSIFSRKFKDKIEVKDTEDDDEELVSFKKYTVAAYCTTGFFNVASCTVLGAYLKKGLQFSKHFSYSSTQRFILFRAIRI